MKTKKTTLPKEEWAYSFDFRIDEDANYQKRYNRLIKTLRELGFVENITTSSLYLYSIERYNLMDIMGKAWKILRDDKHLSNSNDVAILREVAIVNESIGKGNVRVIEHDIYVLAPKRKVWCKVDEYTLHRILYILAWRKRKEQNKKNR